MTGIFQPPFISDFENSESTFEANDDGIDTDASQEEDNISENSGTFLGDVHLQNIVPSTSQTIASCDEGTGSENRQLHLSLIQEMGEEEFGQLVDQVDLTLSEQLERYILHDIQRLRNDSKSPGLVVSHFLSQAAKSNSQYLCGNCVRTCNVMPFHSHSYTVKRSPHESMKWHTRKLTDYMKQANTVIDQLTDHRLREVGVGVWGSSVSFFVTVVL